VKEEEREGGVKRQEEKERNSQPAMTESKKRKERTNKQQEESKSSLFQLGVGCLLQTFLLFHDRSEVFWGGTSACVLSLAASSFFFRPLCTPSHFGEKRRLEA